MVTKVPKLGSEDQSKWLRSDVARSAAGEWKGRMPVYTGFSAIPGRGGVMSTDATTGLGVLHRNGEIYEEQSDGSVVKIESDAQAAAAAFMGTLDLDSGVVVPGRGCRADSVSVSTKIGFASDDMRGAAQRVLARQTAGDGVDIPGVPSGRRGKVALSLQQQGELRRAAMRDRSSRRPGGDSGTGLRVPEAPQGPNKAKELLQSFSGPESYDGHKLVSQFPILFDNTQQPPVSLHHAGLEVIAVRASHDYGVVNGVPDYASYLGRKHVPGVKTGMVSFFVVDSASAKKVKSGIQTQNEGCDVDSYDRGGIFVGGHKGGVSLFGPGLNFLASFNNPATKNQVTAAVDKAVTRYDVRLDLNNQGATHSLEVMNFPGSSRARGVMCTFTLSPTFGLHVNDVRVWRSFSEKFSDIARKNDCIPVIYGNTFTLMTNLDDPTALETHEDVAIAVGQIGEELTQLNKDNQERLGFDARMYRSTATCDRVVGYDNSPVFRGNWTRDGAALGPKAFENRILADADCASFDHRTNARNRFVAATFERFGDRDGVYELVDVAPITDLVKAGQIVEFNGRENEVGFVNAIMDRAREKGLQLCLVDGTTGSGKTATLLKVAHERVGSSRTIVLAFRRKDTLDALIKLASGSKDVLGDTSSKVGALDQSSGKNINVLKGFLGEEEIDGYTYDEEETLDALVYVLEAVGAQGRDAMIILDDFDAAGKRMRTVLPNLLGKLKTRTSHLKNISVFGTRRSVMNQAGSAEADRRYIEVMDALLGGHRLTVREFLLKSVDEEGRESFPFPFEKYVLEKVFQVPVQEATSIDTADLTRLRLICSEMASMGGEVSDKETRVSGHSLKLAVDFLMRYGDRFLTVDEDERSIKCSDSQFRAAQTAFESGELPRGAVNVYRSNIMRLKQDKPKMNLLYLARVLKGIDYRVLEDKGTLQLLGMIRGFEDFSANLSALRRPVGGAAKGGDFDAMLSGDEELDIHALWRDQVDEAMGEERPKKIKTIKNVAFRILLAARKQSDLRERVNPVILFDLAVELDNFGAAEKCVFDAINFAMADHEYAKAADCARFAITRFTDDNAKLCETNFYLAKACLYGGDAEIGKRVLAQYVVPNRAFLPPVLQVEMVEIFLERFRLDVTERQGAMDAEGMIIALGRYTAASAGMAGYLRKPVEGAQREMNWAKIAIRYHEAYALLKRATLHRDGTRETLGSVMRDVPRNPKNPDGEKVSKEVLSAVDLSEVEGVDKKDKGFQVAINECQKLLSYLDSLDVSSRRLDLMKAKVSHLLSSIILEKSRQLCGADEEVMAVRVDSGGNYAANFDRVIKLANRVLLIARQVGGLGADYTVEALASSNRVYAATFTERDLFVLKDFIRAAYEYLSNVDPADADASLGHIYCAAIANMFREMPQDVRSELSKLLVEVARTQHENSPDNMYRIFNYVESLIFTAAETDDSDMAKQAINESYNVLNSSIIEKGIGLDSRHRFALLVLVARHAVVAEAKGDGTVFDYREMLKRTKDPDSNDNDIIGSHRPSSDVSANERALFTGYNGVKSVSSWSDLVRLGKVPALRKLMSALRASSHS